MTVQRKTQNILEKLKIAFLCKEHISLDNFAKPFCKIQNNLCVMLFVYCSFVLSSVFTREDIFVYCQYMRLRSRGESQTI